MTLLRPFGGTLSPREIDVLRAIATGEGYAATAFHLVMAESTVKTHVSSALAKLGAHSALHAIALLDDYRPGWRSQLALPVPYNAPGWAGA